MKDNYAFPHVTPMGEKAPGMELRDWFAGMALQGILTSIVIEQDGFMSVMQMPAICANAYDLADEMLEHRNL
jgi:hypothetical protein